MNPVLRTSKQNLTPLFSFFLSLSLSLFLLSLPPNILKQFFQRVIYDFKADDDVELSVKAGEIVVSLSPVQDDWLMVEKLENPNLRGYIPFSMHERILFWTKTY